MILAADLHLRRSRPRARKDDYRAAQERKFRHILELTQGSPPLLVAGDFFHVAEPGEELLAWVIRLLKEYGVRPVVVPGQHDLPGHSLEQAHRCGLAVLAAAGVVELLVNPQFPTIHGDCMIEGVPYGLEPEQLLPSDDELFYQVILWHHMVINEVPIWPGQVADKAHSLLRKYPQFDLIVTGDNHESFAMAETADLVKVVAEGRAPRWLINPGSMMRSRSDQIDHEPCVYRWEDGKVERLLLLFEDDVWDWAVLEEEKTVAQAGPNPFVHKLGHDWEGGLSFERNLEDTMAAEKTRPEVVEIVRACTTEEIR